MGIRLYSTIHFYSKNKDSLSDLHNKFLSVYKKSKRELDFFDYFKEFEYECPIKWMEYGDTEVDFVCDELEEIKDSDGNYKFVLCLKEWGNKTALPMFIVMLHDMGYNDIKIAARIVDEGVIPMEEWRRYDTDGFIYGKERSEETPTYEWIIANPPSKDDELPF